MFFYQFDTLENFIDNNFTSNLELEMEKVSKIIDLYSNKKSTLLNITNNLMAVTNNLENNELDKFYEINTLIKSCFEELDSILLFASNSRDVLFNVLKLFQKDYMHNIDEIKANLIEYNKKDEELLYKTMDFDKKLVSVMNYAVTFPNITPSIQQQNIPSSYEEIVGDNNILIISEKDQKAYLPYKYIDIIKIYKNHPDIYHSTKDVVNKLYVINLDKFKNSSISRFRETFNLMKNKEHLSIIKSLDLALELMFKFNLNPIVITACKNLNELDIYLDCLDKNELEDFDCFEIKFEFAPLSSKKQNKEFP